MSTFIIVINYAMFIGLLPISFFWLRKAWKVGIKNDMSYVALKRGEPPKNPKKYAKFTVAINFIAGLILAGVFVFILITGLYRYYSTWTAIVGTTIWMKIIAGFIVSRQAHLKRA